MRTSLTALALTAALTGGTTVLATQAHAAPPAPAPVAQAEVDADDGDNTGLWGLLGLLGLAGLIKRKEHADTNDAGRTRH